MSLITLQDRLHAGRSMARTVVLLLMLTGAVIIGLLAMHSLNTHGMGGHARDSTVAVVSAAPAAADAGDHHTGADDEQGCLDCGTGHADMLTMACVLGLLVTLLLLTRPSTTLEWLSSLQYFALRRVSWPCLVALRPPSLTALCISRT